MAEMKYLNTRVQLKYDSHANWTKNNPTLLAGEIAIAYLGPTHTETTPDNKTHPVLFKVGPGNFNSLPWASALAADVYAWAKQENLPIVRASNDGDTEGNVISGISWNETEGKIEYTTASVATSEGMEELQKTINDNKDKWAKDTEYTFTEIEDADGNIVGIDITSNQGASGSGQSINFDFVTDQSLTTILSNYYTKGEIDSLSPLFSGENGIDVTAVGDGDTGRTTIRFELNLDNTGNVQLSTSESGLKADVDLSAYQTIANDKNTAHTHTVGAGLKFDDWSGTGGIDGDVKTLLNIKFNESLVSKNNKKYLQLIDATDASVIAEFDVTEFVKDGMLQSVVADQSANTLTFTWNTDGAVTTTVVSLSEIADIYTPAESATEVQIAIGNDNKISATLVDGGVSAAKLAQTVKEDIAKGVTAYGWGDHAAAGYKTKQTEDKAGTLSGAQVLSSWAQNKNGEVGFQTRDLTPADIGAQPAGNYALKSELPTVNDGTFTVSGEGGLTGSGTMTANQAGNSSANLSIATGGVTTEKIADSAVTTAKIDTKAVTTEKVADNAIGAKQIKAEQGYTGTDAEVWVFCCGDSTTLV